MACFIAGFRSGFRSGGFGDGERRGRDEDMGPSRAEESDDWGSQKRFVPSGGYGGGGSSRGFGGGFRDYDRPRSSQGWRYDDAPPRAADSDNWSRENKFEPSRERGRSGFGSGFYEPAPPRRGYGFRDRDADRRGFDRDFGRTEGDNWNRGRPYTPNSEPGFDQSRGERPKLNLAPRTKAVEPQPVERPEPTTPAKRSNIFGEARPREEVLKERGTDAHSSRYC